MHLLFSDVLWIVLAVGVLASIWAMAGSSKQWQHYGERGMFMESARARESPPPSAAVAAAERISEIRQMVEAANTRRARRGEAPLDVEAEILRLTAAGEPQGSAVPRQAPLPVDPELEDEVRTLVELRNQRRVRKGQEPLDVEAEVARELAALGQTDR
jgi:hypothetical protein